MKKLIYLALAVSFFIACESNREDPDASIYELIRPAHFPEIVYPVENNPITKAGFELGKKLFNDPRLSIDNSVACSNCHVKSLAFTDPQHNPSVGVFDQVGTRNAPMVANMAFQGEFLLDGGISHLDFVSVFAIENEKEMGESLDNVVRKLNDITEYAVLFSDAFPEIDSITSPYMLKSLSQYMLLLVSDNSKYDQVIRGESSFTNSEERGLSIFEQKCSSCHEGALFTNHDFMNNGLDTTFTDIGRYLISETIEDIGKFKVPSLRNIMLTGPYMHDGRLKTIDEVLDHYNSGVLDSPTLADELRNNNSLGIPLSESDREDLINFLETLTDYEFISNPIF